MASGDDLLSTFLPVAPPSVAPAAAPIVAPPQVAAPAHDDLLGSYLTSDAAASQSPTKDLSYRGSFLPVSRDAQGSIHFDPTAGVLGSLFDSAKLPGQVMSGEVPLRDDQGDISPQVIGGAFQLGTAAMPLNQMENIAAKTAVSPAREALFDAARQGYDKARNLGVDYSAPAVGGVASQLKQALEGEGILAELAPKTHAILDKLTGAPEGSVAPLSGIEAARRAVGHAGKDFANPTEQLAASRVKNGLDEFVANPPPEAVVAGPAAEAAGVLADARGNYAAASRSQTVADAVNGADLQAAAANSGQNLGNATRQKFKSILGSDKKASGFSDDELAQMEQIVRGTPVANAARTAGNLLGGGGGLGAAVSATAGNALLPYWGTAAPAVGWGLKRLADGLINRKVSGLDEMVRMRSPLADQLMGDGMATAGISPEQAALAQALMMGSSSNFQQPKASPR